MKTADLAIAALAAGLVVGCSGPDVHPQQPLQPGIGEPAQVSSGYTHADASAEYRAAVTADENQVSATPAGADLEPRDEDRAELRQRRPVPPAATGKVDQTDVVDETQPAPESTRTADDTEAQSPGPFENSIPEQAPDQ